MREACELTGGGGESGEGVRAKPLGGGVHHRLLNVAVHALEGVKAAWNALTAAAAATQTETTQSASPSPH